MKNLHSFQKHTIPVNQVHEDDSPGVCPMFNGAISMLDVGVVMQVKESDDKGGPLEADHGAEHVEGHGAQPVLFQEGHEEAKTDEYHDVNILEHFKKEENHKYA